MNVKTMALNLQEELEAGKWVKMVAKIKMAYFLLDWGYGQTHMHKKDVTLLKIKMPSVSFLWDFSFKGIFIKGPMY